MLSTIKHHGYLLAVLGAVLFSSEGIFIRSISLETPIIVYFQGVFATLIISLFFLFSKNNRLFRPKGSFHGLILVSLVGIVTTLLMYQSMKLIPIAISVFILYLFPLQTIIVSHFFLGEKTNQKIIVSLVLAFSGIILILLFQDIQFTFTNYLGYLLALAASFTCTFIIVFIKKYLTGESSYTVSFYMYLLSAIVLQLWVLLDGSYFTSILSFDIFLLVIFAVVSVVGTLFFVQSLRFIKAQEYSILSYFSPLSAYLLGIFILHQYLNVTSILGGALICIGGLLLFWSKN